MATLAIKGHATRGKEVIELLKMLGGENIFEVSGIVTKYSYYVSSSTIVYDELSIEDNNFVIFTLEEFLEKFPYKVGDKVNYVKYNDEYPSVYTIQGMRWIGATIEYVLDSSGFSALTKDLQPYKEETMEEKGTLVEIDLTRELCVADEVEVILGDYEFVLKDGKTFFVKQKPQYPKTFIECAKILNCFGAAHIDGYKGGLLDKFQELLICRDAYWKIAGDWKPDWEKSEQPKFGLYTFENEIRIINLSVPKNIILVFPTEEIRDIFYKNFKELIELCKELL